MAALLLLAVGALCGRVGSVGAAGDANEPPTTADAGVGASRATTSTTPTSAPSLALPAPGELRLEGLVVDPDDAPVGGAVVALADGRTVTTEADGAFGFDGLGEGRYGVTAELGDQFGEVQDVLLDETSEPVKLILVRGPSLVLHVTGPDATPIAGAKVELSSREFLTDALGGIRIRGVAIDDEYVYASAPGHARTRVKVITSDDPSLTIERTIILLPAARVSGHVVDPDGKPVVDAYVQLEQVVGGVGGVGGAATYTDETGAWQLPDLGEGRYAAHASSKLHIAAPDVPVVVDVAHPTPDLVLHVEQGGEIAGVVVDAAGKPVAAANVVSNAGNEVTDAAGRFVLRGLAPDSYELTAATSLLGGPPTQVVLARGQRAEVTLVLAAWSLAGVVVDAHGEPLEDASVFARIEGSPRSAFERTDEHGRFDLGGLPAGRYQVTVQRSDSKVESKPVEVAQSTRTLRLVAPEAAGIKGRVVLDGAPVPYFGVTITDDPATTWDQVTPVRDASGRFAQRDVAPGTFAVVLVGPTFARQAVANVHVVAGQVTDLGDIAVTRGGVVRGRVTDERGAVIAGARVRITAKSRSGEGLAGLRALLDRERLAVTDARGTFEIAGLPPPSPDADPLRIEASHPAAGISAYRTLAPGETTVDLMLSGTGSLAGHIVHPRPDMRLVTARAAESTSDLPRLDYEAEVETTGAFRFAQLPPGRYDVKIRGSDAQEPQHVEVRAASVTDVVFTFAAEPTELRVHVAGGCETIRVKTPDGASRTSGSCTDGLVVFEDLSPGPYLACVTTTDCHPIVMPSIGSLTVELPAAAPELIDL